MLVRTIFCPKDKMFIFSPAHYHVLTIATIFVGAQSFIVIFKVSFLRKNAILALRGRPQCLKKTSQSQKGHFYVKMNALNDTKTSELSKSAEDNGEYL